jgi:outer membrane protein assembly factor BamB
MKSSWKVKLLPGLVAALAVVALAMWLELEPATDLQARVPGLDRPEGGAAARPALPLVGTLEAFDVEPPELPGSWPQFRGPQLDGMAHDGTTLAREWPEGGPPVLWSLKLGEGHAGAAVHNGRVYVLDYDRENEADALRCFTLDGGKEIWRFSYPVVIKRNHGMSRTMPAVTDQYVVGFGPKCHVCCLDPQSGESHWLIDLTREHGAKVPPWYAGQCPLIENGAAILAPGGEALLMAIDCATGDVLWKSPNPRAWTMTHSSITPMEFGGRRMYVYCGKGGVAGIDAADGSLLWDTTDWKISIATCPSPVILPEGRIFLSGGYNAGALMLQVEPSGGGFAAKTLFRLGPKEFGSTQHTPLFYEGHLFGVRERDKELVCLDLEGNEVWSSGSDARFGIGPYLIADGLIFVMDDAGKLTLAEATTEAYRPLAEAQVLSGHDSWGPMSMVGGRLFVRDLTEMKCLDVTEGSQLAAP